MIATLRLGSKRPKPIIRKSTRVESIDLLRGIVMIVMALDHVRDYFHHDAFIYSPTDLYRTSVPLFFTRFITHYCAPVFVFLAGIVANLYGAKRNRKQLSFFLFSRGLWLIVAELFIVGFGRTFNPAFPLFNLQVIWAIGISMLLLSVMIFARIELLFVTAVLLITAHNLLDDVHVHGNSASSFVWSVLHEPGDFIFGRFRVFVHYPVLPWTGIMALGYCLGNLYHQSFDSKKRKKILFFSGVSITVTFFILRLSNVYGDAAHWSPQTINHLVYLSFLNVTKYPPSLLYTLVTLGPAMIFLALAEKPLNAFTAKIAVFGRVPFFYYIVHVYLIHILALMAAIISGHNWRDMILSDSVNKVQALKSYGFSLLTVYAVWIGLILMLYPCCKWFDKYKRTHQVKKSWLSYL